jgi:hypothetical protein
MGYEIYFLDFFYIFLPQTIKNNQIYIQMIEFEFKQINQNVTSHYHPPTLAMDSSVDSTT